MKYKVGDKIRIKSLDWYNENNDGSGILSYKISGIPFTSEMAEYCGSIVTIDKAEAARNSHLGDRYIIKEDDGDWAWHEKMFEGLVEEETYDFLKTDKPNKPSLNDFMDMLDNEIKLPEGYIFKDENGNVINATKIILEKKKPKYPQSYLECVAVLGGAAIVDINTYYYRKQLNALYKLLICRNAYWKIAGEEMELGKSWEPDWCNEKIKYCLVNIPIYRGVCKRQYTDIKCILAFPTEEMRNAFYENFKSEIEICKELL